MHNDIGPKRRVLRVLLALVESPGMYTKKNLADLFEASEETIKHDFEAIRDVGFIMEYDPVNYRYRIVPQKPLKQLKELLHFSEEDQALLYRAIDQITAHDKRGQLLKKKLASLYDYRKLGHTYLRKPYLTKIDLLMQAKNEKRQVILRDYSSSNSSDVRDRLVEPFHPSPADDTLQAFDVEKSEIRHFRISRFSRLEMTDTLWQFEGHHTIYPTDVFRIVDKDQVLVHLRIGVGPKNELIERFPMSQTYIQPAEEEGIYDFQCLVNRKFLGLTNFILGYYHQHIEVLEPESLLQHLQAEIEKMHFFP